MPSITTRLDTLPVELVNTMLAHVPLTTVPALALTCRALRTSSQAQLFRTLRVAPIHNNLSVIPILASTPRLCGYVRDFQLVLPASTDDTMLTHGFAPCSPSNPLHGLYTHLCLALSHMAPSLLSLSLMLSPHASSVLDLSAATPRPVFPVLRTFTCQFPLTASVRTFLAHTPVLLSLSLDSPGYNHNLDDPQSLIHQSDIPHLQSLISLPSTVSQLVPGRPVHDVHVLASLPEDLDAVQVPTVEHEDEATLLLPSLSQSTAPQGIQNLSIATSSPILPFLHALHEHVPNVVQLDVATTYCFGEGFDTEFYDRAAEALGALPSLRAFKISGMAWPTAHSSTETDSELSMGQAMEHKAGPHSWRPANLPLPPPPGHVPVAPTDAQGDDMYDFYDYLP